MSQQTFESAKTHHQAGRFNEAAALYRQTLAEEPNHVPSLGNLASILIEQRQFAEAITLLERLIERQENSPPAHGLLGVAYYQSGRLEDAVTEYRRAIALQPNLADAHNNLGAALRDLGRPAEAIVAYRAALAIRPDYAEVYGNLGNALRELGQNAEAVKTFHTALRLRPNQLSIYSDLAAAFYDLMHLDEAIEALNRVLAEQPNDWRALNNLAATYRARGMIDKAIECYDKILIADPENSVVPHNRLYLLNFRPKADPKQTFEEHREWGRRVEKPPPEFHRSPGRSLRIGYVSGDFRQHSVAYFSLPLLQSHDRSQFHITCYSASPRQDSVTEQFRACADQWIDLHTLSDEAAVRRIITDEIDILVDLAGHTSNNRLLLFARKPAPIQVAYLGYPNTTGLTTMDWRLTDSLADPPENDAFYTEKLFRLDRTAWCFSPLSGSPAVVKSDRKAIAFGSFNDLSKVNEPLLDLWTRLLKQIPGARLVLKNLATSSNSVSDQLARRGIDVLPPAPDNRAHLLCYHQIDIALDTFPYHGTTTTCEAMWMGVPVITLVGKPHASRVGVSLLKAVGLEDLVAGNEDEYIRIAAQLAHDQARRAELRFTLRDRMKSSPLMDATGLARAIESAYQVMSSQWTNR